jgi:MFS family permease
MGLGFTFYSGAVEAWLVDALKFTGFAGSLDSVFARGSIISGGAMLIGTVAGGLLGTINLGLPYIIRAVLLAVVFIVAFFLMHDLGYQSRALKLKTLPGEMRLTLQASIQHGWVKQPVRLLMIVYFIQSAFFTWAFYAWQPYFLELLGQPEAIWIAGIISALIALAMIIGNSLVERLARYCARRTTLLIWAAVVQSIAAISLGLSSSFWLALVMLLIMMGAAGVTQPVAQAYMHGLIPSKERATIISFNSMIGSAGSIIGQSGLGRISLQRTIPAGYVVGGLFTLLALPVILRLRRLENTVDPIEGEAGTKSPAAAQGLPNVCAVDTDAVVI